MVGLYCRYSQVVFAARYGLLVERLVARIEYARRYELAHKILLVQIPSHIRPDK